jgi:hypothetical protein
MADKDFFELGGGGVVSTNECENVEVVLPQSGTAFGAEGVKRGGGWRGGSRGK